MPKKTASILRIRYWFLYAWAARGTRLRLIRRLGITIGMAIDTAPQNILVNLLMGLVGCRLSKKASDAVLNKDLYDAVKLSGARMFGRTNIGRILARVKADITKRYASQALLHDADSRHGHHAGSRRLGLGET